MFLVRQAFLPAWLAVLAALLGGCATALPSLDGRATTQALEDTADTRLGRAVQAERTPARPASTRC